MKKIYYNGVIRTMCKEETVEAVLTDGASVSMVGDYRALVDTAPDAEQINLCGNTMLPAFIDTHSHLSSYATSFLQVSLEECHTFDEIADCVRHYIKENKIKTGVWVIARGYDHNSLSEKKHPSLLLLDTCAPENPLVLQHISGHVGVMNSLALERLEITADTQPPEGGCIGTSDGRLNGYLEENAFVTYLKKIPMSSVEDMIGAYQKAQQSYASYGITTVQEGLTVSQMLPLYQFLVSKKLLNLDVVAYLMPQEAEAFLRMYAGTAGVYNNHFRLGGYKIILDGSPQGRTAWMRTPYKNETPPYFGYNTMSDEAVMKAVKTAVTQKMQLLAHCNGDAAAEQYINAIKAVKKETGATPVRSVMIHAQLVGTDQLDDIKTLKIIPSFFVAHVYHWGDTHIENFGIERASKISPAGSALDKGILFTFHQDTPVIEPNMLETVWCAVNRATKSGAVLGEDEKISVREALKAITINAAYQYGEEERKGSIEPGKVADFVLLDRDPVSCNPMDIRKIKVVQTIKDGDIIFSR